jgi:KUP system potassium uptake protein
MKQPAGVSHMSKPEDKIRLAVLAVGIVFGDIGTSPIYAFKAAFAPEYALAPTPQTVVGLVSLVIWALVITVSLKYVAFIMRADNKGEGGILALLALIRSKSPQWLILFGLFGAALLYGDGIITPAISVLSAVEGLGVYAPELARLSVPLAVGILFGLFAVQRFGVRGVGHVFGPIMVLWFLTIAAFGAMGIARDPRVLWALNPVQALRFLGSHGYQGFTVLGAVVLAVTGAEALYADMGYFGKGPIRYSWFGLIFPALVLNYAGQGALVMASPSAIANPFYLLVPTALQYPMVGLATIATVIASQALISGVFALTNQTVQLGFSPRLIIVHTAPESKHVYVPAVNRFLMIACLILVVTFESSGALGAAYGIAVSGTMAITTVLFHQLTRTQWHWSRLRAGIVAGGFLVVDLAFLFANSLKVAHDGWVPLVVGIAIWILMTTWAWGRQCVAHIRQQGVEPLEHFLSHIDRDGTVRVPGTAVYLTSHPYGVPRSLKRQVETLHVLTAEIALVSVDNEERPRVPEDERVSIERLGHGFSRIIVRYGFLEQPNLSAALQKSTDVSYVLTGEWLAVGPDRNPIRRWRKRLFIALVRNSRSAPDFFNLPARQVIELGEEVTL